MRAFFLRLCVIAFSALTLAFLSLAPRTAHSQNENVGNGSTNPSTSFQQGYNDGLQKGLQAARGPAVAAAANTIPPPDSGSSSSGGC